MSVARQAHPSEETESFAADVIDGLSQAQKSIPCQWLYDEQGSALFEEITALPEYYPTRTETAILTEHAPRIADAIGPRAALVEYGAGASVKTRLLLNAMAAPRAYAPIDVSEAFLKASAAALAQDYPALAVRPVVGDFLGPLRLPEEAGAPPIAGFFPGSTIGNLGDDEIEAFMTRARRTLGDGAWFILGADLAKDEAVLTPAYEDAAGVTAAFNLNLLARINRELGADFDLGGFRHEARWNAARSRIEMHLVSAERQSVDVRGRRFTFEAGESIHTENSRKFRLDSLEPQLAETGWSVAEILTDARRYFAVLLLRAA